jgi:hypothetical protein
MRRTAWSVCLAAVGCLFPGDLSACGDKLLVVGRHLRSARAHGAVQRASILVLLDGRGHIQAALRETRLKRDLELAGHKLRLVSTPGELAAQVGSGRHDILIADVSEAAALRTGVLAAPGSPILLPVVTDAEVDPGQAEARLSCVERSPSAGKHYLAVIEKVMAQRRTQAPARP